jgi:ferredoxin
VTLQLRIDPTACTGHGVCAALLPERIQLDEWGYPIIRPDGSPARAADARRAGRGCPVLALRLQRVPPSQQEGASAP